MTPIWSLLSAVLERLHELQATNCDKDLIFDLLKGFCYQKHLNKDQDLRERLRCPIQAVQLLGKFAPIRINKLILIGNNDSHMVITVLISVAVLGSLHVIKILA